MKITSVLALSCFQAILFGAVIAHEKPKEATRLRTTSLQSISEEKYATLTDAQGSAAQRVLRLNHCSFQGIGLNSNLNPNSGGLYFKHVVNVVDEKYELSEQYFSDSNCRSFIATYHKYEFPNEYANLTLSNSFELPHIRGHFENFYADSSCGELIGYMFYPVAEAGNNATCIKANPIL
jgi:hypothetical protein